MAKHKGVKKKKKTKEPSQERLIKGLRFFSEEDYDKARISFVSVLKANPENPGIYHMLGETLLRSGDLENGKINYETAFSKGPDAWIARGLSRLKLSLRDQEGAENILKDFLKDNKSSWGYLNLASFYKESGELDKAIEVFNKASVSDLPVIWGLVQILLNRDNTSERTEEFSKVLTLVPDTWMGYYILSRCFMRQEQFDKAMENIDNSINAIRTEMTNIPKYLYPFYSKLMAYIYLERVILSFERKNYDDVVTSGLTILRNNPRLWQIMYFLGVGYLYQGLVDKGRGALMKFCEALEGDLKEYYFSLWISSRLLIGQSYINQSAFREAISVYKEIIEEDPEIIDAYLNSGYSYFCLGEMEEAKNMFKKLLSFKPDNLLALNNLGFLEMHQRNFGTAKNYFRKAIEHSPDYPLPYANLGFILTIEKNYEEAQEILVKSLKSKEPEDATLKVIYPSSVEENIRKGGPPIEENKSISSHIACLANLGTTMARCNNYRGAHLCFDRLIEKVPNYHFGYRGKAWTYFLEGDYNAAASYMRKAFEKNSENKVIQIEYNFIQNKADLPAETKKMASILEGFFSQQNRENSLETSAEMNKVIEEVIFTDGSANLDLTIWDNFLIDVKDLFLVEKQFNNELEEDFKELEMVSSWRRVKLGDTDED